MSSKEIAINYLITNLNMTELEAMPSKRIKKIRKFYNLTQVNFAKLLMVNYETYRSWEEERRFPSSPGCAILHIAEKYPKVFLENSKDIIKRLRNGGY